MNMLTLLLLASLYVTTSQITGSGIKVLWKSETSFGITSSPAQSEASGLVYYVSKGGWVTTVNVKSGEKSWHYNTKQGLLETSTTSSPLVKGTSIFLGGAKALDSVTGKPLWRRDLPGTQSSDVGSDSQGNQVYVGSTRDGTLYALNPASGSIIWRTRLLGEKLSKPEVYEGLPGSSSTLVLICSLPSKTRQSFDPSAPLARDGYIHAIDARNGRLIWRYTPKRTTSFFGAPSAQVPVLIRNVTLVVTSSTTFGDENHYIHALNAHTGDEVWRYPHNSRVLSAPVVCPYDAAGEGSVYFASLDGTVISLKAETGEQRWKVRLKAAVSGSPALICNLASRTGVGQDVSLFIGTNGGSLVSLQRATGMIRWSFDEPKNAIITSPLILREKEAGATIPSEPLSDSHLSIVFGSLDGNLYKIRGPPRKSNSGSGGRKGGLMTPGDAYSPGLGSGANGKGNRKKNEDDVEPTSAPVSHVRSGSGDDEVPYVWAVILLMLLLGSLVVFIYHEYRERVRVGVERVKLEVTAVVERAKERAPFLVLVAESCIFLIRSAGVTLRGVTKAVTGRTKSLRKRLRAYLGAAQPKKRRTTDRRLDLAPLGSQSVSPGRRQGQGDRDYHSVALSDSGEDEEGEGEGEEEGEGEGEGEDGQLTFSPVPPSCEPHVRQRGMPTESESTREFFEI